MNQRSNILTTVPISGHNVWARTANNGHIRPDYYLCQRGYVSLGLSAGLRNTYWSNFHKIRWKGGTQVRKNPLDYGSNPDHFMLRLWLTF